VPNRKISARARDTVQAYPVPPSADAAVLLIGLQHGAGLIAVHDNRPEVLNRDVGRQTELVVLPAVQGVVVGIFDSPGVLGTTANALSTGVLTSIHNRLHTLQRNKAALDHSIQNR
jgi:hypothetical protein